MHSGTSGRAKAWEITKKRFATIPSDGQFIGDLIDLDETSCYMSRQDLDELKREQAAQRQSHAHLDQLANEFREWRKAKDDAMSNSTGARKKRSIPWAGPKKLPTKVKETFTQAELKVLVPEECRVWIDRTGASWNGRYASERIVYHPWKREGGEYPAAIALARSMWRSHFRAAGLPLTMCPIKDLFSD